MVAPLTTSVPRPIDEKGSTKLFGDGLPPEIGPFSFVPMSGMRELADLLQLHAGQTLVDLGCGRGGPGLWLAADSCCGLVGIDSSTVAITDARCRRQLFPHATAAFFVADVAATGLPADSAHAVVSVDVVQLLDDPRALIVEAARVLRPGGRFVLTTWEGRQDAPARFPPNVGELLESTGLRVDVIAERPGWLERQLTIYERAAAITAPDSAVDDLAHEGTRWAALHRKLRRVVASAQLPE
ncbi:class I SAM-dependent methyltransferase [Flexivirga alba]|uniref:Class I SAM-dependent methyltransferase n=1 Tax=Flexivirga alba TaxID=702742 RepID=A0ABW2AC37_9MICO